MKRLYCMSALIPVLDEVSQLSMTGVMWDLRKRPQGNTARKLLSAIVWVYRAPCLLGVPSFPDVSECSNSPLEGLTGTSVDFFTGKDFILPAGQDW